MQKTKSKPKNWKEVNLGEVCEIEKGDLITEAKSSEGNIPVIAGGKQPSYYHNEENREGKTITISASGAYAGFINYFEKPIFASDCNTVKPKNKNEVLTKFIFYILKAMQSSIYRLQKGSGQPHVYGRDLKGVPLLLPSTKEQKKIVKALNKIQEAIDTQDDLIDKTEELKKSLMNKLFAEGTKGEKQKNTKIGKIPESWGIVNLSDGNIANINYGKSKPKKEGSVPVIGSSGIYGYVNKSLIKKPTIVIGRKGSAGEVYKINKRCWPSDTTFYLDLNISKIDIDYLFIAFKNYKFQLSGEHNKTTLPSLARYDLESFILPLPNKEKQKEIADILQKVDEKIENHKNKKEKYEELFKSMLHKLMTGEIRVNNLDL